MIRALFLLSLLAGCATVPIEQPVSKPVMGVLPGELDTTQRREALVLAEHAYTGALMAAQLKLNSGKLSDWQLQQMSQAEARASDALDYLRTLENADDKGFTWALHFYAISIRELNKVTEGDNTAPEEGYHVHH